MRNADRLQVFNSLDVVEECIRRGELDQSEAEAIWIRLKQIELVIRSQTKPTTIDLHRI